MSHIKYFIDALNVKRSGKPTLIDQKLILKFYGSYY